MYSQVKDEINDPVEKYFRVKFFSGALSSSFVEKGGGGGGWGVFEWGRAGGSKSFGTFHYVCRGVLVAMVVGAA